MNPPVKLGAEAYFIWGKESVAVPSREFPVAFGYDAEDPAPSDHYNPAAVEYPYAQNAYFAFPSPYMHFPEPPVGKYGNDVEKVVTWKGNSDLAALSGQPVCLRFVMRATKLFAFQFAGD